MQVIAKKKHRYGGKSRQPNEPYEARDRHVKFLTSMGWVKPEADQKPVRVTDFSDKGIVAAVHAAFGAKSEQPEVMVYEGESEEKPKTRKYKRRDMVPED